MSSNSEVEMHQHSDCLTVTVGIDRGAYFWGPRARHLARIFGINTECPRPAILNRVDVPMSGITFITGVSGAGKSTLLQAILRHNSNARSLPTLDLNDAQPVSMLPCSVEDAISWFGRFGLGEAVVLVTSAKNLSIGQRFRLRLALLMWERPSVVVIDEFLSNLDPISGAVAAYNFQKVCRKQGTIAYVASAHDYYLEALAPDQVLRLDMNGASHTERVPPKPPNLEFMRRIVVREGKREHFNQLNRFHYAEDLAIDWEDERLAIRVAILDDRPVGVGVYGPPLPAAYECVSLIRQINETVIALLRTIVHPAFRGIGLTRLLLPEPKQKTRLLSSFSAMGVYVPFHLSHGFSRADHPRGTRRPDHDRLEQALIDLGVADLAAIYDPTNAQGLCERLPSAARDEIRRLVSEVIVRDNTEYCHYLAREAELDISPITLTELRHVFTQAVNRVPNSSLGILLSEALYFPMQGFVKRIGQPADL